MLRLDPSNRNTLVLHRRRWLSAAIAAFAGGATAACYPGAYLGPPAPEPQTAPPPAPTAVPTAPVAPAPTTALAPVIVPTPTPAVVRYIASGPAVSRITILQLPLRLEIPKLRVDAPILAVGLTPDGAMDVPKQADEVAWYQHGPPPGSRGNAVLAGHVDWRGVRGVFAQLHELAPGDLIIVRGADDARKQFALEWLTDWPTTEAPVATVFAATLNAVVTLITCGGRYNRDTRQYDRRVVARAMEV